MRSTHATTPDPAVVAADGPLLTIRNLSVDFAVEGRTVQAVRDAGLTVFPGRTTALVKNIQIV